MNNQELKQNAQYCLNMNLRKATRSIARFYGDALQSTPLERTQFTLLAAISGFGQVAISELAQALVMDQTTVTRNVQALERKSFVQLKPGEDRRVRLVSLTDEGQAALAEAAPLRTQAQTEIVDALGEEKANELLALLNQVVEITTG